MTTVCRRLDGLPLAIELAAPLVRVLDPEQIADHLDQALSVLTGGPRAAAARQQTLRATLDWSYELLGDRERRLFEQVSGTWADAGHGPGAPAWAVAGVASMPFRARKGNRMSVLLDLDFYRDNGYVLARGVFGQDEVATLRREVAALLERAERAGRKTEATWGGGWREAAGVGAATAVETRVDSIHNVQNHSATFTRMLVDPRLVDRAAELIGPNVQLHHTKLHNKPPVVGSPFPMHQDYPYFPHEGDSMIAAIVHLDDATVENGCLCVVPGSHRLGPIEHRNDGNFYLPLDEWPLENAVPVEAQAGDLLFFGYGMVHGSYVNRSDRPRRIVLVQMRSPSDRPLDDSHRSPGQGTMLRGYNPDVMQR